jgi:hypothetical protein
MKLLITDDPKVLQEFLRRKANHRVIRTTQASLLQNYCSWEPEVAEMISDPATLNALEILCQKSFTHWQDPANIGRPDWLAFVTLEGFRLNVMEVIHPDDV